MTLPQMKALVMVFDKGTLAAAARELGISSAAVSKQLILLEKDLGLQLMTRSTRSIEFNEIGKSYVDQCKRIFEEIDVAKALVDQMKTVPQGRLKVVSGRYFAALYILPYVGEFLSLFPNIYFNIELAERLPNFDEEAVDVLIGMTIPSTGNVIQKKIEGARSCFCASPDYLQKFGTPKVPKDLMKHRHIIHSMRTPSNILIFPNKETVPITPYICINDSQAMVKMAQEGLGIIKTHYPLVQHLLYKKILIELLPDYIEKEVPFYVSFPQRRYVSSKVKSFVDFTLDKVKSQNTL
jgi:DNA-binding transcriptional LysR family regulator